MKQKSKIKLAIACNSVTLAACIVKISELTMFCVICGSVSDTKTCSPRCRVALHRMNVRSADGVGYLYVVEFDDVIKFGSSKDPAIRVRQVELSSGRVGGKLSVFGPFVGAGLIESRIHKTASCWRICGEWYDKIAHGDIVALIGAEEAVEGEEIFAAMAVCDLNLAIEAATTEASRMFQCGWNENFGDIEVFCCSGFRNVVDLTMSAVSLARKARASNAVSSTLASILGIPDRMTGLSHLNDDVIEALVYASFALAITCESADLVFDGYESRIGRHGALWASECSGYILKQYSK